MSRNEALFLAIADRIEQEPESYNQRDWILSSRDCGTAGCLAGHACILGGRIYFYDGYWRMAPFFQNYSTEAQQLLGLDTRESDLLFAACWEPRPPLTVPDALRKLATGDPVTSVTSAETLSYFGIDECD